MAMATTATLNGGPTGGLHTTPTLIHTSSSSDNPPQEETCRVDSNSSFESGNDEHIGTNARGGGGSCVEGDEDPLNNNTSNPNAYFTDFSSKKRRKQSRPVRIPMDPSDQGESGLLPSEGQGEGGGTQGPRSHVPLNLSGRNESSSSDDETSKPSSFITSHRNSSNENDKTELLEGHGTKDSPHHRGVNSSNNTASSLPPSSFSPGLFPPGPFGSLFSTANLGLLPHQNQPITSTSNTISSSAGVPNLPPHRIFNPEAYCDLCNKEFCNKYFLKTHKANKHGVYTEMPPSLGQVIAANSPSNAAYLSGPAALLSSVPSNSPGTTSSNTPQQREGLGGSSSGTGLPSGGTKGSSIITSDIQFTLPSFSSTEKGGSSGGSNSSQRESFCELCQKEFCNKYFLKRHKAKIHGINVENSSSSGRHSSGGSQGKMGYPKYPNGGGEKGYRDMGMDGMEGMVVKHGDDTNLGEREEGELSADDEHREMMIRKSSPVGGESDDNSSSVQAMPTPNMNAENTCQFCLRDFSSKQHLINHMIKKHQLMIPSNFPPILFPFPALLGEEGNVEGGGEGEYECKNCNRSFQNIYLLQMHKSYFHPESQGQEHTGSEQSKYGQSNKQFCNEDYQTNERETENEQPNEERERVEKHESTNACGSGKTSPSHDDNNPRKSSRKEGKKGISDADWKGEPTSAETDDLRRLQTMIMELNRASAAMAWNPPIGDAALAGHLSLPPMGAIPQSGRGSTTMCQICNKEFYSTYFFQQHMQHFHPQTGSSNGGGGGVEPFGVIKSESPMRSVTPNEQHAGNPLRIKSEPFMPSELSGGGGKKGESHPGLSVTPDSAKERMGMGQDPFPPESQSGLGSSNGAFLAPSPKTGSSSSSNPANKDSGKRPSPSLSRSYCTICHKELCNKYFMRTHMLKMHGISIESSTGLGGVTCDICNKELCSKYFLKVHKQNTHGIVEDGPSPPTSSSSATVSGSNTVPSNTGGNSSFSLLGNSSLTGLNLSTSSSVAEPKSGGNPEPGNSPQGGSGLSRDGGDIKNRYFSHYSEVCPFPNCGTRFRSPKWLKSHLQQEHGEEGGERWKSIERGLRRSQKLSSSPNAVPSPSSGRGVYSGDPSASLPSSRRDPNMTSGSRSSRGEHDANKCAFCPFSTGDVEGMKLHLIKEHSGQLANRQAFSEAAIFSEVQSGMLLDPLTMLFQKMEGGNAKIYRCSYCPFTTSILVYLYAHERTHTGLAGGNMTHQPPTEGSPFQCPICFQSFDQVETFQQHLIGHQMSGVLAPFFTPSTATNASGRLGFLSSPTGAACEGNQDPRTLLSLPLLNGNASENLYWAMKNPPSTSSHTEEHRNGESVQGISEIASSEPAADLSIEKSRKRTHEKPDNTTEAELRKRRKTVYFRCFYCKMRFNTKDLAMTHVRQAHHGGLRKSKKANDGNRDVRRSKKRFKCRKCKFTSTSHQAIVVHRMLQHLSGRSNQLPPTISTGTDTSDRLPEGRGVAQEEGGFLIQGFLLASSGEEENNCFVPSVVYLPVREKVSQSIRVSFSLTPTSRQDSEREEERKQQHHQ